MIVIAGKANNKQPKIATIKNIALSISTLIIVYLLGIDQVLSPMHLLLHLYCNWQYWYH
jgi:hypothetical protein